MSVKIFRDLIDENQVNIIRSMLNITPKVKPNFNKTNFMVPETPKEPIQFYMVKDDPITKKKCVYLPFQFANKLYNTICNYNNQYPFRKFKFLGSLRDYQIEDMKLACSDLSSYCSTMLNFSTGAGKTICASFLSTAIVPQYLTMVLLHLTSLVPQWKKAFQENTNAKIWIVGDEDMPVEFDVIICMEQRVKNIPAEITAQIGVLIIDEIDRLTTKSRVEPLLATQPKYIIGLTATADMRADGLDVMIDCLIGTHKVVRNLTKEITLYRVSTEFVPPVIKTSRGTKWDEVIDYLAENEERNNMIVDFVLRNYKHKILIMCNLIKHTKTLYDKINVFKIKAEKGEIDNPNYSKDPKDYITDFYSGNKKKFTNGRILIGGIKKIGIGFDDASSDDFDGIRINMLVMANSVKDESLIYQVLGRIRDPKPIIIYPVDNNDTIKRHYTVSRKYVEERKGKIHNINEIVFKNLVIKKDDENNKDDDEKKNDKEEDIKNETIFKSEIL